MKLAGAVMDVVRGVGGAALIATAACSAGCGAASTPAAPPPAHIVTVGANDAPPVQPKPSTTVSYDPEPDYAVACGRG